MSEYRFALLGCGAIAKKHLTALDRLDMTRAVAVCDINPEKAQLVGEEWNLPFYSDPHAMLKEQQVDIVTILTPSGNHAQDILDLVAYGKHFLVEKPLALRIEDVDRIIEACNDFGCKIFEVKQNRCNRPIAALRRALDAGRFGQLTLITVRVRWCRHQQYYKAADWRGTWAMDGGVVSNQANHHVDLLAWLGGPIDSVMAMTCRALADIEAEDTATALIRFTSGALGILEATTATRPRDMEGSLSILGERGTVEVGGFYTNELKTWEFEEKAQEDDEIFERWGANPEGFAWNHTEYINRVIQNLEGSSLGIVDGLEARRMVELINAIYESAETGQAIPLRFKSNFSRLGQ